MFREAARKDRRVSLRVNDRDLDAIQARAAANGLLSDAHRHHPSPGSHGKDDDYTVSGTFLAIHLPGGLA